MFVLFLTYLITSGILTFLIFLLWFFTSIILRFLRSRRRVSYRRFGYVNIILALLWAGSLIYGFQWGRWRHEVKDYTYADSRIPHGFDGYRIVHISDLHLEGFVDNPVYLDTLIQTINRLHPDLICFTGDLVSISHHGVKTFQSVLSHLTARDGVVSVLGNHDYGVYCPHLDSLQQEKDCQQVIDFQRNVLGWKLLLNESLILHHNGDSIAILGSENQNCGPHQKVHRGNLNQTMKGTSGMFQLLLTHDPTHWDAEVVGHTDIPLTLSGHTHAMQFMVFGITPCNLFFPRSHGEYRVGRQTIYVNIGLGQLMPFRIGATPEITLITLKNSASF